MKQRHIREKGRVSLLITAYFVSIFFIVASLVPLSWMISSALKDNKTIYAFPPQWIPDMPQTVTVTLDVGSMPEQDRQTLEMEAAKATWFTWKKHQNEAIGELRVIEIKDGKKILEAKTPSYLFTAGRSDIVPAQVFTDAIMNTKYPLIQERGYTKFTWYGDNGTAAASEAGMQEAGSPAELVRSFLEEAEFRNAELVSVFQYDNPLRMFDNFIVLWTMNAQSGGFRIPLYLLNSVIVTGATILCHFFVGGLSGYALSRLVSRKWAARWMLFFVATIMIPEIAVLVPLYLTMEKLNLVNTLLAIILPHSAWGIVIFLFKGFFDQLPGELLQAARIDGASEFGIYTRLVIPLSLPIFTVVGVMTFLAVWNEFLWPLVVARNESVWTLTVAINDFQNRQTIGANVLMASLFVATIPTLLVFLFCQRLIEQGVAWTGVKG